MHLPGSGACNLAVAGTRASQKDAPEHQEGLHQGEGPEAQVVQIPDCAPKEPTVVVELVHALTYGKISCTGSPQEDTVQAEKLVMRSRSSCQACIFFNP